MTARLGKSVTPKRVIAGVLAAMIGLTLTSSCGGEQGSAGDNAANGEVQRKMESSDGCKDAVPRELLTTQDGELADVYVLKFTDTFLYVPASWFMREVFAESYRPGERRTDELDPLLTRDECPGLIHHVRLAARIQLYLHLSKGEGSLPEDFPVNRIVLKSMGRRGPVVSDYTNYGPPDEYGWAQMGQGTNFADAESLKAGGYPYLVTSSRDHSSSVVGVRDVATAEYHWREEHVPRPEWRQLRARMTRVVEWLTTSPSQRNSAQML
jgi:hypothetical protein